MVTNTTANETELHQMNIKVLVEEFVSNLSEAVKAQTKHQLQQTLVAIANTAGMGPSEAPVRRGPGRPPKNTANAFGGLQPQLDNLPRLQRRRAKVLCPIPGCKNVAAPIFGGLCKEHKNTPKALVKKYREERRQSKLQ